MLQVGDQLGDTDSSAFALALAKKLRENKWDDGKKKESAQICLQSLTSNVKSLVFQQVGRGCEVIHDIIGSWPLAMQHVRF